MSKIDEFMVKNGKPLKPKKQPKDGKTIFLSESGKRSDGVVIFHVSNNMEMLAKRQGLQRIVARWELEKPLPRSTRTGDSPPALGTGGDRR